MHKEYELIIRPEKTFSRFWGELWDYRDLFYFLAWRDFKVRYKQTVIGAAWAIIRPLITMLIFTVVFGKIAKLPSEGIPYPILVFSAMLPWYFFASTVQESTGSLINDANIISKVYFPRIIVPTSALFVNCIDFIISMFMLFILMAIYQVMPGIKILLLPAFFIVLLITTVGLGLWLSALNVSYRDFRYVVPFILQLGLYISPVGFSSYAVSAKWHIFYALNPLVGIIDSMRWAILDTQIDWSSVAVSATVGLLLFISGIWYFQTMEKKFADII